MKFLVDAQLPQSFCGWREQAGHDARHTIHLPNGNRTTDQALVDIADREGRVVITKDSDFVQSLLITGRPQRLLLISTGNVSNKELERLVRVALPDICQALEQSRFVELGRAALMVRA